MFNDAPKIYVACLASYNAGTLHGRWIDLDQNLDDVWTDIDTILKQSPEPDAEEWAIHDYEGFGKYPLSEYEGIERTHALAAFVIEHEAVGLALIEQYSGDLEQAQRVLENYAGCYETSRDFVMEYMADTMASIPDWLERYVDYEAIDRDMQLNGEIEVIETAHNEVHVFYC